ncbi:MAG: hypothetical protein HQ478_00060 [Chloroflexi bacterium]|nr:hypothetical protein [Chloroflexota bacterium]
MVSDPGDLIGKDADISLCIFPHLNEIVVVDGRTDIPDRPLFEVMQMREVFTDTFYEDVQNDFKSLLHRDERPFFKILSLPHELEGLIKLHGLRAVLSKLDPSTPLSSPADMPNVALLILTGPFLTLDEAGLRESLHEMFSSQLEGSRLDECVDAVTALAAEEREATNNGKGGELTSLITGESAHYATIWQNSEGSHWE